jgi:SAM-dependent methyltransferase
MTDKSPDRAHWTRFSAEWTAWARTPGHDAFWSFRDAFVEFVGAGTGAALDIGCGEGRISRELKALGYRVTASDAVGELVDAARDWDSAHDYAVAGASALPFADASFDLAVAYNVLMDVEDVPAALREARRVLKADGTLVISIVHPFLDHGKFESEDPDAPFVMEGSYFGRQRFESVDERDGLTMHFAGWSQPLENYAAALAAAGFAITALSEPQPKFDAADERLRMFERVPLFMWIKAAPFRR